MVDYYENLDLKNLCRYVLKEYPKTSELKLNKLLYFIQAGSIHYFGEKVFKEVILAGQYGPIIKEACLLYKSKEKLLEKKCEAIRPTSLKTLIDEILEHFANLSSFYLVDLTMSYSSWKRAWSLGTDIPFWSIKECHKELAIKQEGYIF